MQQPKASGNDLFTTAPTARIFDVSPQTIIQWANKGYLRALKTANGIRLFRREDIERLKKEREGKRA